MQAYAGKLVIGTWPQGYVLCWDGAQEWSVLGRLGLPEGRQGCNEVNDPKGTLGRVYALQTGLVVSHEFDIGGSWTHLAAVREGRQLYLYVNGELSRSSCAPRVHIFNLSTSQPLLVGCGPHSYFEGAMADLRYYQGALDANEIRKLSHQSRFSG